MNTRKKGPGGVTKLTKILSHVDRKTEQQIMASLGERDQKVAEKVRERLTTFDDLLRMDDRTIQAALRHIDMRTLTLALRGATAELMDKIGRNMSQRAAQRLVDDIEALGPQHRSKVGEAQQGIMRHLRDLERTGRITLARDDDPVIE